MNKTAPSVSFEKFWETIKNLGITGLPDKPITSEYFDSYKTPNKYLLITAYQFFELINDKGEPTDRLRRLFFSGLDAQAVFRECVENSYAEIFSKDVTSIDKNTLYRTLNEHYNLKNDSAVKKGMSFFKQACEKAEVELSDNLSNRSGITAKLIPNENEQNDETPNMDTQIGNNPPPKNNGANFVNTVILASGGKLTLSAEVDVWKLGKDDRELVFTLVDAMNGYEKE